MHYKLKGSRLLTVEDMVEFEDDDVNNVVMNLKQPQNIFHPEVLATNGTLAVQAAAEVLANATSPLFLPLLL